MLFIFLYVPLRYPRVQLLPFSSQGSGSRDILSNTAVFFTNIRNLIRKRDKLDSLIDTCDANTVVLTETWLSAKIRDAELFPVPKHFKIFLHYWELRNGGGILVGVRDCILSFCVDSNSSIEITIVCITFIIKDSFWDAVIVPLRVMFTSSRKYMMC